mmetsp:Transcript_14576/g.32847  ORF Transcript_14576/g.32847 Transcript_14576/m.32847 type:complete len:730 (+) Transcript_14576:162-2351(+)
MASSSGDGLVYLPLKIILIGLDFLVTLVTFSWLNAVKQLLEPATKIRSVPVADDPSCRVHPDYVESLQTKPSNNASTLYEILSISSRKYPDEVCFRQRKFLGMKSPKIKEFGPVPIEVTYKQADEMVHRFGAALRSKGIVASPTTTTLEKNTAPCRMAIFENTCPEWMIACLGAVTQSVAVVTVYATLGIDAVGEAINDNAITTIVCNRTNVETVLQKSAEMPSLKVIIYTNDLVAPKDISAELPAPPSGVEVFSFESFLELGDTAAYPAVPPTPETTAVVMYTSGSTGKPKGVVITHANVVASVANADFSTEFSPRHRYLAYLPLAHIMELVIEFTMLLNGCSMNYADPRSLSATGAYPSGAMEFYRPSLLVGVPKIWDTIRKGVQGFIKKSPPLAQAVINTAIAWRSFAISNGFDTPLLNATIFKKIKQKVGGELQLGLSGGGPLSTESQNFIRVAFGTTLLQGYGLTESCGTVSAQALDDMRGGVQGFPLPSTQIKLVSTPEITDKGGLPYLSTDRVDVDGTKVWGRGEILIKGMNVSKGYYMQPEKTKEDFSNDGWFATGDIGQFLEDGSLSIVDRKKNLVKLSGGEYVALEKMEIIYGNSDYVDAIAGGVCAYADGDMDRPVALIQLNTNAAKAWAKGKGVSEDVEQLKHDSEFIDVVMDSLLTEYYKGELSKIEKLGGVVLLTTPWTPESGCLTAANKLQRRNVAQQFPRELEEARKKGIFRR